MRDEGAREREGGVSAGHGSASRLAATTRPSLRAAIFLSFLITSAISLPLILHFTSIHSNDLILQPCALLPFRCTNVPTKDET